MQHVDNDNDNDQRKLKKMPKSKKERLSEGVREREGSMQKTMNAAAAATVDNVVQGQSRGVDGFSWIGCLANACS